MLCSECKNTPSREWVVPIWGVDIPTFDHPGKKSSRNIQDWGCKFSPKRETHLLHLSAEVGERPTGQRSAGLYAMPTDP